MTLSQKVTRLRFGFFVLLGTVLFASPQAKGQEFNYTLQHDSVAWQPLNSFTMLNLVNAPWETSYRVPIGFSFPFLGQTFDSIIVASNGSLSFDATKRYSMIMYHTFGNVQDTSGNWSVLGYNLSGDSGARTLTIQYTNVADPVFPNKSMSYQILIHENGIVDVISGTLSQSIIQDSLLGYCAIGLVNLQMDSPVSGLFVELGAGGYQTQQITETNSSIPQLSILPNTGKRFRFIPNP
jgi:hypothetical protein